MIEDDRILSIKNVRDQCERYNDFYGDLTGTVTQLLFVETDGNQIIDTGYKPNQNTRVVMDVYIPKQDSYPRCIFGARNSNSITSGGNSGFSLWAIDLLHYRSDYNSSNATLNIRSVGYPIIDKNKNVTTINSVSQTFNKATFDSDATLWLFCMHNSGTTETDNRRLKCKFFSCHIYDNDELVRYFVPAKNGEEVGLFDKVEGIFYSNIGSGSFIGGPERKIPSDYEEIEYLQSNPTNSSNGGYIDTGIKTSDHAEIMGEFQYISVGKWVHGTIFGGRDNNSYDNRLCFGHNTSSGFRFDYHKANVGVKLSTYTDRMRLGAYDNVCVLSNGSQLVGTEGTFNSKYPIYLFSIDTQGTSSNCGNLKLFKFFIKTDSGERYFIPVKRLSDNTPGLYDLSTQAFFTNNDSTKKDFSQGEATKHTGFSSIIVLNDETTRTANLNLIEKYGKFGFNKLLGKREISAKNLKQILSKIYTNEKDIIDTVLAPPSLPQGDSEEKPEKIKTLIFQGLFNNGYDVSRNISVYLCSAQDMQITKMNTTYVNYNSSDTRSLILKKNLKYTFEATDFYVTARSGIAIGYLLKTSSYVTTDNTVFQSDDARGTSSSVGHSTPVSGSKTYDNIPASTQLWFNINYTSTYGRNNFVGIGGTFKIYAYI